MTMWPDVRTPLMPDIDPARDIAEGREPVLARHQIVQYETPQLKEPEPIITARNYTTVDEPTNPARDLTIARLEREVGELKDQMGRMVAALARHLGIDLSK